MYHCIFTVLNSCSHSSSDDSDDHDVNKGTKKKKKTKKKKVDTSLDSSSSDKKAKAKKMVRKKKKKVVESESETMDISSDSDSSSSEEEIVVISTKYEFPRQDPILLWSRAWQKYFSVSQHCVTVSVNKQLNRLVNYLQARWQFLIILTQTNLLSANWCQ